MFIHIHNQQKVLPISDESVKEVVSAFLSRIEKKYDEVSIYFVEEPEICRLHQEFFDDPSPTDCISFPMDFDDDIGPSILGDIFVSPQAAISYGGDVYEETTLYVIHGLLHLLGYDDIEEDDITEMRALEKIHLDHLKANRIYLHP